MLKKLIVFLAVVLIPTIVLADKPKGHHNGNRPNSHDNCRPDYRPRPSFNFGIYRPYPAYPAYPVYPYYGPYIYGPYDPYYRPGLYLEFGPRFRLDINR